MCLLLGSFCLQPSEDDKAASKCALLHRCQPESCVRKESGNWEEGGGFTALRGPFCLFCFHTVFNDKSEISCQIGFDCRAWLGLARPRRQTLVPKALLRFWHHAPRRSSCHDAPSAPSLRLFAMLKQQLRKEGIAAIPSSTA